MTALNKFQLRLLKKAATRLREKDYLRYIELRRLLAERPPGYKPYFEKIFSAYYGLNQAQLGAVFQQEYFRRLFALRRPRRADPYTPILRDLYRLPRRKKDHALQCSFVSKLVAIHDESRPIVDRHVSNFFGITVPEYGTVNFRIAGFVANIQTLRETYTEWSTDARFQRILASVRRNHAKLAGCADMRIADLLVWTAGRGQVWKGS